MSECKHKWVFQEKQRKTNCTYESNGDWTAHFHKIDVYYCEHCCEIKQIEKKESVSLPFGGIEHVEDFAPIWY